MTPDFSQSDFVLNHLDGLIANADAFIASRYSGFVAVAAVTTFEIIIREKLIAFCTSKHKVFGAFSEALFQKTNARIKVEHLRTDYLKRFGDKYLKRFDARLEQLEAEGLREGVGSIKTSYKNIVQWRHDFVHDGRLPEYAGYPEARLAYQNGKRVVTLFCESLK